MIFRASPCISEPLDVPPRDIAHIDGGLSTDIYDTKFAVAAFEFGAFDC